MSVLIALGTLSLLIFIHELGHYLAARWAGVDVVSFSVGLGPALISRSWRGTLWSVRLIPLGGYVSMKQANEGQEPTATCYEATSIFRRLIILLAGPGMNVVGATMILTIVMNMGWRMDIAEYLEASPWIEETVILSDPAPGTTPGSIEHHVRVKPLLTLPAAAGISIAGTAVVLIYVPYSLLFKDTPEDPAQESSITGPVGIVANTSKAASKGVFALLLEAFALSISLAALNLLPFPPLDGGRIALLIPEKLFGKERIQIFEIATSLTGIVLFIGFFVWVTIKDLIALIF